jgi:hypothetical protein
MDSTIPEHMLFRIAHVAAPAPSYRRSYCCYAICATAKVARARGPWRRCDFKPKYRYCSFRVKKKKKKKILKFSGEKFQK